jgi:hypothetical protein
MVCGWFGDDAAHDGGDGIERLAHGVASPAKARGAECELVFQLVKLRIGKVCQFDQLGI